MTQKLFLLFAFLLFTLGDISAQTRPNRPSSGPRTNVSNTSKPSSQQGQNDNRELVRSYMQAAEQGDRIAQKKLADCYMDGKGVAKNGELALKWCKKAAEQNLSSAQYTLGTYYYYGNMIDVVNRVDKDMALYWFELADKNSDDNSLTKTQIYTLIKLKDELRAQGYTSSRTSNDPRPQRPGATNAKKISAEIKEITMEHGITNEDGVKGVNVCVSFNVNNMKGLEGKCVVYFETKDGRGLKDLNGKYCTTNGYVATHRNFTPGYDSSTYTKFKIFFPISELDITNSGQHSLRVYSRIFYNGNFIETGTTKYAYFTYTK